MHSLAPLQVRGIVGELLYLISLQAFTQKLTGEEGDEEELLLHMGNDSKISFRRLLRETPSYSLQ